MQVEYGYIYNQLIVEVDAYKGNGILWLSVLP